MQSLTKTNNTDSTGNAVKANIQMFYNKARFDDYESAAEILTDPLIFNGKRRESTAPT